MYILIEYRENYSKTSESVWNIPEMNQMIAEQILNSVNLEEK